MCIKSTGTYLSHSYLKFLSHQEAAFESRSKGNIECGVLQLVKLWLFHNTFMVGDDDAGPLVDDWDEEEGRAKDGHQEEGPEKHSVQDLRDKLPVLDHLR